MKALEPRTLCLVHGAFHGAWCFGPLRSELERLGFRVVTPDLPATDPSAGLQECVQVVVDALATAGSDVVLVGHSLGCLTAPLVADRCPASHIVYLTGLPALPGRSLYDSMEEYGVEVPVELILVDQGDGTVFPAPGVARAAFFHDLSEAEAQWAIGRLRRQARLPMDEPSPLDEFPDVPATFVVCMDDRALPPPSLHRVAAHLGVPVIELPGSHSPFLSRPSVLAETLRSVCCSPNASGDTSTLG